MNTAIRAFYQSAADKKLALMLDLDGATLHRLPGIHTPVAPDFEYDAALRTLAENDCPVTINTGRPSIFVNNVFPSLMTARDLPIWSSTETGAHITGPNNELVFRKGVPNIDSLREHFKAEVAPFTGGFIEDHKMCAITIALKQVPEHSRGEAYSHMLSVATEVEKRNPDVHVIPVWKPDDVYIEIVPEVNKGTAALHMMQNPAFAGKTTFAFGDSSADEAMMAVVRDHNGYGVGVGGSIGHHVSDIKLQDYKESQRMIKKAAGLASGALALEDVLREEMPRVQPRQLRM